jgi:hypothetical protein
MGGGAARAFVLGNVDAWADDAGESKGNMPADSGTTFWYVCRMQDA